MRKYNSAAFAVAFAAATALTSQAALTPVATSGSWDGDPVPGTLYNVMQSLLANGSYDVNAAANRVQDTGPGVTDQIWTINGTATTALLLEIAGYSGINSFGIYNLNTLAKLQVFTGSDSGVSTKTVTFSGGTATVGSDSLVVGSSFGFYLSTLGGPTWYSRQSDNPNGGLDQMVTQKTAIDRVLHLDAAGLGAWKKPPGTTIDWKAGEYLLGWEDLSLTGGDKDYQDMLVKVSAVPVPEPTTIIAGALLLLPFGASTIRFIRKHRTA